MSEISQLDEQIAAALARLRSSLADRQAASSAAITEQPDLQARIGALESENAGLRDELERLSEKRDKDVAALDDLIAQLKPLIEEV